MLSCLRRRTLPVALAALTLATKAKAEGPSADHGYGGFVFTAVGAMPGTSTSSLAGGYGASFRAHGIPELALDLGLSHITGDNRQGRFSRDIPLTLLALVYPWPGGAVQPYLVGGAGHSWSHVEGDDGGASRSGYVGGQLGGGVETFLHPSLALSVDMRGFLRGRVSGAAPESGGENNAGVLLNVGLAFYLFNKY